MGFYYLPSIMALRSLALVGAAFWLSSLLMYIHTIVSPGSSTDEWMNETP